MCSFHCVFSKWTILIWVAICIIRINAKVDSTDSNFDLFSFDEIKFDLLKSDFNNSSIVYKFNERISTQKCLTELAAIKDGLANSDGWAMKSALILYQIILGCAIIVYLFSLQVVDSWGKIPSTWFSGNSYEFGGFSECLNIERNGEMYKTQYCLGHLLFDLNRASAPNSAEFMDELAHFRGSQFFQKINDPVITPFIVVPK